MAGESEMVTPRCTSWLGHKFEARFDVSNPALEKLIGSIASIEIRDTTIHAMQSRTYVGDICVRCGATVHRAALSKPQQ